MEIKDVIFNKNKITLKNIDKQIFEIIPYTEVEIKYMCRYGGEICASGYLLPYQYYGHLIMINNKKDRHIRIVDISGIKTTEDVNVYIGLETNNTVVYTKCRKDYFKNKYKGDKNIKFAAKEDVFDIEKMCELFFNVNENYKEVSLDDFNEIERHIGVIDYIINGGIYGNK